MILNKSNLFLVIGPSDIPFAEDYPKPKAMTAEDLARVEQGFVDAVERCKKIGCMSFSSTTTLSPVCL